MMNKPKGHAPSQSFIVSELYGSRGDVQPAPIRMNEASNVGRNRQMLTATPCHASRGYEHTQPKLQLSKLF